MQKLDQRSQFFYVPRQAPGLEEKYPKLADSDFNTGMRLIKNAGDIYVGADALYQIYRLLPPFHFLAWLYRIPVLHSIFRAGYAVIARYRHLLGAVPCDTRACDLSFGERQAAAATRGKKLGAI
jgi:predicted DCC family thiol-disulfide oxidoreductase YuxK